MTKFGFIEIPFNVKPNFEHASVDVMKAVVLPYLYSYSSGYRCQQDDKHDLFQITIRH